MPSVARRLRRTAAALLLLAGASPLVAGPALAAPGDPVSFSGPGQSERREGPTGVHVDQTCTGPEDPDCPAFEVTLSGAPLALRAQLEGSRPTTDVDLHLYRRGERVASSGSPSGSERIDAVLEAGTYTVVVQPYTTAPGDAYALDLSTAEVEPNGGRVALAVGQAHTFEGPAPTGGPAATCVGDADPRCRSHLVSVAAAGTRLTAAERSTSTPPADEYALYLYDTRHALLASATFVDGPDQLEANLPGPGDYLVVVASTTSGPTSTYALDLTLADGTTGSHPVSPQPGPQPEDAGRFTRTLGFASKTGYRGVLAWQASSPVQGVVEYGTHPSALTATAAAPGPADTAQLVILEGLEPARIYFWRVRDLLTGEVSVTKSFASANAYSDWGPQGSYTIDLLVQLDSQSLPPEVPSDLALADIAQGLDVFAERVFDATDGFVRIGEVLVTDTLVDHAANVPFTGRVGPCTPTNYADVLVQTSVPFDSHTYGGYAIADPCTQFYVGRVGQLVIPWADDLHFGYVSTHELSHYAFSAPDLYDPSADVVGEGGCTNDEWDGSLMDNSGGWDGARWRLTEFDRNAALTPCDHSDDPVYTWDALRARYLNVPLRPEGPIEHVVDDAARGNADGGGLRIHVLDREPASSTLSPFTADDRDEPDVVCGAGSFSDPAGDSHAAQQEGGVNEPGLDLTQLSTGSTADDRVAFTFEVVDLGEQPPVGTTGDSFAWELTVAGEAWEVGADRFTGLPPTGYATRGGADVDGVEATFDPAADRVTVLVPSEAFPGGEHPVTGSTARTGRILGAIVLFEDRAGQGTCPLVVVGTGPGAVVPEAPVVLLPIAAVAAALVVARRRRGRRPAAV